MSVSDVLCDKASILPRAMLLVALTVFARSESQGAGADASNGDQAPARIGVLTLINGDTIGGQLEASPSSDVIRWQGTEFVAPFQFRTAAIKSLKFPDPRGKHKQPGEFAFELTSGDVITGRLGGWTSDAVTISSEQFGRMRVRTDSLRRFHRLEENATSVFASLAGLQDWATTQWGTAGWNEDGDHLWTNKPGATLNGDLGVPSRAVVEFEVSWNDQPDFVVAIGVNNKTASDTDTDGWRFETVGGKLAVVRQYDETADVDVVADLTHRQSIHLSAYLDQSTGQMQAFLADGSPAGHLFSSLRGQREQQSKPARGVRVINRGRDLRLRRLRISQWLGDIPAGGEAGPSRIALSDGGFVSGTILRFDVKSGSLVIGDHDQRSSIKLADVIAARFPSAEVSSDSPQCALFLRGGTRLSGDLESIDDQHWILSGESLQAAVRIPRHQVRTMIVFEHDAADPSSDESQGRSGRLELGSHQLIGHLAPTGEPETTNQPTTDASCLRWHPYGSHNASCLRRNVSGRIVYRDSPEASMTTADARALAMQMLRKRQQQRGLNFGELFLRRADSTKSNAVQRDAHVVHARSGDVIACRVESIDARGVHVSTAESDHGFLPHARVKAIEFVNNSPPPDLEAAKRDRLLTIPRLQKSSPPTHLMCSHNGDFLRCRLTRLDQESVRVWVQLEEIEIPRDRVAQIIWFHPDESDAVGDAKPEEEKTVQSESPLAGLAQVLRSDGKRVTFEPATVTDAFIEGTSELLGTCRFELSDVDQLILGSRIRKEVYDLAYNGWRLHPAVEPLAAQEPADGPGVGSESELIGQQAPEIKLDLLSGDLFRLSDDKGRIVVLDFWATWCAPCMQTMPLLVEAVSRFDPTQVRLVSINLEESADQVQAALERHDLQLTVALDVDGIAAASYQAQAIPQTVIVGADGKVKRLLVGGGINVVEQMEAAITELLESNPR